MARGPTIVAVHNAASQGGINCCFCRCCTCLQLQVLKSPEGIIKLAQILLGFFCQSLALNFGAGYASTIGSSYQSFLSTASWCLLTSFLLLFSYVCSQKSLNLLRSSLFETLFNGVAALSYFGSCSYLGWAVNTFLQPMYIITPFFQVYPAMSAAYMMGTILGFIYAYDGYKSYQYFKGFR
ncbi:protein singles bar [Diabrotica undecimpunctata]|uniref:protein singles bar n=1 Tax=Diabrotica undecimpunctata TaxID=50387 RepID=UPI003B638EBF